MNSLCVVQQEFSLTQAICAATKSVLELLMSLNKAAPHFLFLCVIALGGCATSGVNSLKNETNDSISEKIEIGATTKQEVFAMLGSPSDTSFTDSGLEVIKYEHTRLTPRARNFIPYNIFSQVSDGKKKELVILFSNADVVSKFVLNEVALGERWGVFE
jgi:outer membrane protein assembly factor BamE (lipoprotein component of BamABCDE complex)